MNKEYIEPEMIEIRHIQKEKSFILDMVQIEAKGKSFMMGSEDGLDREKPVHKVTFDYNYELGKTPVTIEQYMYFVYDTNSHYPEWLEEWNEYNILTGSDNHYKKLDLLNPAREQTPIVGVSWQDAKAYCDWLSKKSGDKYRLPTEAEWEYACRAGTTTKWSFGDDKSKLKEYAWYEDNSNSKTQEVGLKKPNPWGLYDMHGNVWEWCEDDWENNYNSTPRDGSAHENKNTRYKVLRGGSWLDDADDTRSAYRFYWGVDDRSNYVGFRLLRVIK